MKLSSLLLFSCLWIGLAAPKSRFTKDINEEKLDKEWADEEDEGWHEDTHEWKRKLAEKKMKPLDMNELQKAVKEKRAQDAVLEREAQSGNVQMSFATIKSSVTTDAKVIEEIGQRWSSLLATDGVQIKVYPVGGQDLLLTEDNGRILQVRDFLLKQPELEKFRWKDTDFTPAPTPTPKAAKKAKATKKTARTDL